MPERTVLPITGEKFDLFLDLCGYPNHHEVFQNQWKDLEHRIETPTSSTAPIDLNAIFQELMVLKILMLPTVQDLQAPYTEKEFLRVANQSKTCQERFDTIQLGYQQLQKKHPNANKLLEPIVRLLREIHQTLQHEWKEFDNHWKQLNSEDTAFSSEVFERNDATQEDVQKAVDELATQIDQGFNRVRWHALLRTFKMLAIELKYRWTLLGEIEKDDQSIAHPALHALITEIRDIYAQTQDFKLIENIKKIRKRTQQIALHVQKIVPHEIILEETLPEPPGFSVPKPITTPKPSASSSHTLFDARWQRVLLVGGVVVLGMGGLILWKHYAPQISPEALSQKVKVNRKSLHPSHAPTVLLRTKKLKQMTTDVGSDIPVLSFESERQILEKQQNFPEVAPDPITRAPFISTDHENYYLYWEGNVTKYESLDPLKTTMEALSAQENKLMQAAEVLKEYLDSYDLIIEPAWANGRHLYQMLFEREQVTMGKLHLTPEGYDLEWNGTHIIIPEKDPKRVIQMIQSLMTQK